MIHMVALVYLLGCSIYDFIWKKLPVWIVIAGGGLGLIIGLGQICVSGKRDWLDLFWGLIPGICVTGLALIAEDRIGLGGGVVLLTLGLILGIELTIMAAVVGLFLATLVGVVLMAVKKVGLQTTVPFIPFLTLGLLIGFFSGR